MLHFKKQYFLYLSAVIAVCAFVGNGWQNSLAETSGDEEFYQTVKDALAEIKFPKTDDQNEINAVAENLAAFIEYRSGVRLSAENKKLLGELEVKSRNQSKRIKQGDLTRLLSNIAVERISGASDADLNYVVKSLSGFDAPDLLPYYKGDRKHINLRANGEGYIEKGEFLEQAKVLRETVKTNKIVQSFISNAVNREVSDCIDLLAKASPNDFGNSRNFLTPAQAILVTYSVVSDDRLARNQKDLLQMMEAIRSTQMRLSGKSYPSPNGYKAYGDNGYIFSSPVSLLLDDATVAKILNGIKAKSEIE